MPNAWGDAEVNEWGDAPAESAPLSLGASHKPGESDYKEHVLSKALNVPVTLLTGDPVADRKIAEAAWNRGSTRPLTPRDALQTGALLASLASGSLGLGPAAAGAVGGGLWAAGTSKADSPGQFATDVAVGTATGGATGKGLDLAVNHVARPLGQFLVDKGIKYGRKALSGVSSSLARRKPIPEEAVREAFNVRAIRPGSTVEGIANRLQDAADPLSAEYGSILQRLEAAGVHGPEAERMAAELARDASTAAQNSIIGTRAGALQSTADELGTKALPVTGRGRLGLMQAENMKRELQADAATQYVKEGPTSLAGGAKKEIAGRFKDAIEQAVTDQAALAPQDAAAFQPVKERLHRTLTALGAAREGAARYARRSPFGLHEAMGLATGIASGNPVEAAGAAGLMSALKERGASTLGSSFFRGGEWLNGLPMSRTPETQAILNALSGEEGLSIMDALRRKFGGAEPRRGE
jgi:hypothetical protein